MANRKSKKRKQEIEKGRSSRRRREERNVLAQPQTNPRRRYPEMTCLLRFTLNDEKKGQVEMKRRTEGGYE